jgi:hypothetical protein
MSVPVGALALDGGDARDPNSGEMAAIRAHDEQLTHDSSISFEEYVHYAALTRADEKAANEVFLRRRGPRTFKNTIQSRFSKGNSNHEINAPDHHLDEKNLDDKTDSPRGSDNMNVSTSEWNNASRALRTAGWGSVFFLITTDILGPFSTPWAFAQMGYGPGIALYTVFGVLAG